MKEKMNVSIKSGFINVSKALAVGFTGLVLLVSIFCKCLDDTFKKSKLAGFVCKLVKINIWLLMVSITKNAFAGFVNLLPHVTVVTATGSRFYLLLIVLLLVHNKIYKSKANKTISVYIELFKMSPLGVAYYMNYNMMLSALPVLEVPVHLLSQQVLKTEDEERSQFTGNSLAYMHSVAFMMLFLEVACAVVVGLSSLSMFI